MTQQNIWLLASTTDKIQIDDRDEHEIKIDEGDTMKGKAKQKRESRN